MVGNKGNPFLGARDWFDIGMKAWASFDEGEILPELRLANDGAIEDYLNINGCRYYQWSASLIDAMRPKQVVELGGAMGVWTICASYTLLPSSKLYSITLPEHGLDFAYMPVPPPNVFLLRGDDLDMSNWEGVDLKNTDLWFIDTGIADDHFAEQLQKELKLYAPYFKKGAVILLDDIHKNKGMEGVWNALVLDPRFDCYDGTDPLHWTGFGVCVFKGHVN